MDDVEKEISTLINENLNPAAEVEITEHDLKKCTLGFGKHYGEGIQRVPAGYLDWMVNSRTPQWEYAQAEIMRRGHVTPDVDLSPHAINNASLRCMEIFRYDHKEGEGLHTWLMRITKEAIRKGKPLDDDGNRTIKYGWKDMKIVVFIGAEHPVLKTIMRRTF